jgi:hypothetical protein
LSGSLESSRSIDSNAGPDLSRRPDSPPLTLLVAHGPQPSACPAILAEGATVAAVVPG